MPGKKALQGSDTVFEIVLVDVSEQPVSVQKAKNGIIAAKEASKHPKSAGDGGSKKYPDHNHRF
ncbi:MAG: hypothetical protein U0X92_01855 [Anaerolineales bacterium]